MRSRWLKLNAAALCGLASLIGASAMTPDAARGRAAFEKRCTGCHAVDRIKAGPPMKGVFGRPAASDRQFTYSDSLKKSQVLWDARTLDKWLADPDGFVPGNDMSFRLENANERADIIEYLKQLGGH